MKKVQRMGGKMMKRSADVADVGSVIAEFKATDEMLEKLIKDLKAWRNGWEDILKLQYDQIEAFATLYKSIEPVNSPEMTHVPAETPHSFIQKCLALQKIYSDMKDDLAQEVGMITTKIIQPMEETKANCKTLYKTLKHRENMKLDYERFLSRAVHARKKDLKSVKEESTLAKCESDLAQAHIDYQTADDQVKQTFPPLTDAVMALMPYLAANQVMLQTTLVGHLYTMLDAYCRRQGFPSPAPSDAEIVAKWESEYTMFKKELEGGLAIIAKGKAVSMPMRLPEQGNTVTGMGLRNKVMSRNTSSQALVPHRPGASPGPSISEHGSYHEEEEAAPSKPPRPGAVPAFGGHPDSQYSTPSIPMGSKPRIPSFSSQTSNYAPYDQKSTALVPSYPNNQTPAWMDNQSSGATTPPSRYATPSPIPPSNDYFAANGRRTSGASFASSAASVAAAAKKKPPPPVPAKRFPSAQAQFVTALYDFEGQNAGDLAFREGDKIRIVKKTESTDDWWEGELKGRTGAFPANYV